MQYNKQESLLLNQLTIQILIHYLQSVCILFFSEFGFVTFKVPRQFVTGLRFS